MEGLPLGVRKGAWTEEEDLLLKKYIEKHGEGKWHQVPSKAGLNRCRKSCRLRWLNYLKPNIKRGDFDGDEIDLIIRLHKLLGNRWSLIAGRLPGRTANDVKNYWNTHLLKKFNPPNKPKKASNPHNVRNPSNYPNNNNNNHNYNVVIKPRPRSLIKKSFSRFHHCENDDVDGGGNNNNVATIVSNSNGLIEGDSSYNSNPSESDEMLWENYLLMTGNEVVDLQYQAGEEADGWFNYGYNPSGMEEAEDGLMLKSSEEILGEMGKVVEEAAAGCNQSCWDQLVCDVELWN